MANICLTFGTATDESEILKALTTLDGLASWWTQDTSGDPTEGGTITFTFGDNGGFDMRVIKSNPTQVHWECINGPDDWLGTRIEFDIHPQDTHNQVMFRHAGWSSENPFFYHCSTKWATFLLSLRDYVEEGKGRPFPEDIKIEATGM
ncbi:SRPBCC domain-containing protein [Halomonas sp. QHL1]|uniref:SRPBCC family protein n=1 Tax=Halomonas sp. QHL1 TaxID=1123773 RepID=UPI0008FD0ADB|nr:SRPBCC domain-containing protein [Halomonas sp. QHL1]OJA05245.1 polyketide cyclase [Halomonas sp. QHL1]